MVLTKQIPMVMIFDIKALDDTDFQSSEFSTTNNDNQDYQQYGFPSINIPINGDVQAWQTSRNAFLLFVVF